MRFAKLSKRPTEIDAYEDAVGLWMGRCGMGSADDVAVVEKVRLAVYLTINTRISEPTSLVKDDRLHQGHLAVTS